MLAGLGQMPFQDALQLRTGGGFDEFRQGGGDALFRIMHIRQLIYKKDFECFHGGLFDTSHNFLCIHTARNKLSCD
jgi:hypothetical protein